MTFAFDESNEAMSDLPVPLQTALKSYFKSGSDEDLNKVIILALKDYGAQMVDGGVSDDTNFITDLGLDSLGISEFVFFFEDIFQVRITNEELLSLNTFGELRAFLSVKLD